MALRDILVHLDDHKELGQRLDTACALAVEHAAHLTGLYVMHPLQMPVYAEVQIPGAILAEHEQALRRKASAAQGAFAAAAERGGCAYEWRCVEGYTDQALIEQARYTDLLIVAQAQEGGLQSADAAIDDRVILGSGRPVLVIPYIGTQAPPGRRVLVAWDASREAVRAVGDALPLLQRAAHVTVLAVNPPEQEEVAAADICLHLARHGVSAEASQTVAKHLDVGDALLSRAADLGVDLIVMGAYGHSRLRETVFGGVTRHLLRHMTVPVLMSH